MKKRTSDTYDIFLFSRVVSEKIIKTERSDSYILLKYKKKTFYYKKTHELYINMYEIPLKKEYNKTKNKNLLKCIY